MKGVESVETEGTNENIDNLLKLNDEDRGQQEEITFPSITRHNVITSPWSRLGVIAIPFGLGFFGIFLFFNSIFNPDNHLIKKTIETPDLTSPSPTLDKTDDGDVRAQLALNKQQSELDKINNKSVKVSKPPKIAASPPVSHPTPIQTPRHFTASPPQIQTSIIKVNPTNKVVDPATEFQRLRNIGSFGTITYTSTSTPNTVWSGNSRLRQAEGVGGVGGEEKPRLNFASRYPSGSLASSASPTSPTHTYSPQEEQIIQEQQPHYLVVGQSARGVLVTPVVKQQADSYLLKTNDNGKRYVAKIVEDLHDNDGNTAIKAGTLLAVEVLGINNNNSATLQVTSIITNNIEYPIPNGTISVSGESGRPIAGRDNLNSDSLITRYDLIAGGFSGISKVGEILNQSNFSSTVFNSGTGGFSSNITNNSRRNITGAFLQGAFGKVSDNIVQRIQASTKESTQRSKVWYIPQGTKVIFMVNRSLELGSLKNNSYIPNPNP